MTLNINEEIQTLYSGINADRIVLSSRKKMTVTNTLASLDIPYEFGRNGKILIKKEGCPIYAYEKKSARWHRTDKTVRSGGVGVESLVDRIMQDDAHDLSDWHENQGLAKYLKLIEGRGVLLH